MSQSSKKNIVFHCYFLNKSEIILNFTKNFNEFGQVLNFLVFSNAFSMFVECSRKLNNKERLKHT